MIEIYCKVEEAPPRCKVCGDRLYKVDDEDDGLIKRCWACGRKHDLDGNLIKREWEQVTRGRPSAR